MELSTCCDAERWNDLEGDIYSYCREHADFVEEDENSVKCDWCLNKTDSWIEIEGFEFCDEDFERSFYNARK